MTKTSDSEHVFSIKFPLINNLIFSRLVVLTIVLASCGKSKGDWGATVGDCDEVCTVYFAAQRELMKTWKIYDRDFPNKVLRRKHVTSIDNGHKITSWFQTINQQGDTIKKLFTCEVYLSQNAEIGYKVARLITKDTTPDIQKTIHDSSTYLGLQNISEPFKVSEIDKLDFTSGGGEEIENHKNCDSLRTGFYGSYFLIDPDLRNKKGAPIGGTITIYSEKEMLAWRSTDTDQTIWRIHLKTNAISVWDSIRVGMNLQQIEKFGELNNGLFKKKNDNAYSHHFNNYTVDYIFQNDTLKELTINRKCYKE